MQISAFLDSALHFFANKEVFIPSKHPNVRRHKNQEEKKEIQRRDRCLGVTDAWTRQVPGHDEAPGAEWDVRGGTRCQGGSGGVARCRSGARRWTEEVLS